jgi:hypothetical protein
VYKNELNIVNNINHSCIADSTVHGKGLFCSSTVRNGEILGVLDGQIISTASYESIKDSITIESEDIKSSLFMEWNVLNKETLLVRAFRTKYSFINHSRTPNLKLVCYPIKVIATRDIKVGEEFLLDYREGLLSEDYLQGHGKSYL